MKMTLTIILSVLTAVSTHKYAGPFLEPVSHEEAPDYDQVIRRRMDLATIKKNMESGVTNNSLPVPSISLSLSASSTSLLLLTNAYNRLIPALSLLEIYC